ncbi:MAG: SMC-Scp complex subunit ScpB [Spirochaetales bacterium]|nr:SMC-Scp complex subunit ScpB [Spirochaetales bacterium]
MKLEREAALIEAVLLLESDPVDLRTLMKVTNLSKDVILLALEELQKVYDTKEHGIEVVELGGGHLFTPKVELWEFLKEHYGKKNENRLSRAALETLSIIAYSQPITRGEIENIRGVSADGMIKLLFSRNLIREVGKKDAPGRPIQFGTTRDFLKAFRIKSIADLPKLDELTEDRFELNGR